MEDREKIAPLFAGWEETFLWSYLQGYMGYAVTDGNRKPASAQIVVGDFCFFAGVPNAALAARAAASIMVPQTEQWGGLLEAVWGARAEKALRYAMKKEENNFSVSRLTEYAAALPPEFTLRLFDERLYEEALGERWSRDLCAQFASWGDYRRRGLGVSVTCGGRLAAGASSYLVYSGGIEIEIDTKPELRRNGLAAACGARLMLECFDRGLYPSWDAHDLRSAALAEKLGYLVERPYVVYIKKEELGENTE